MTDTPTTDILAQRLKSTRTWLVVAVVVTGAAAWVSAAGAGNAEFVGTDYRGAVSLAVVLGSAEAAYLSWRNGGHAERRLSAASATGATLGSLLIALGATTQAEGAGTASVAAGVGLLGIACFIGIFGLYRATGKSSAATLTGMFVATGLAYIASMLWSAIPS